MKTYWNLCMEYDVVCFTTKHLAELAWTDHGDQDAYILEFNGTLDEHGAVYDVENNAYYTLVE